MHLLPFSAVSYFLKENAFIFGFALLDLKAVTDIHLRVVTHLNAMQFRYAKPDCFSLALTGGRNPIVNIAQRRKGSAHRSWSQVSPQG